MKTPTYFPQALGKRVVVAQRADNKLYYILSVEALGPLLQQIDQRQPGFADRVWDLLASYDVDTEFLLLTNDPVSAVFNAEVRPQIQPSFVLSALELKIAAALAIAGLTTIDEECNLMGCTPDQYHDCVEPAVIDYLVENNLGPYEGADHINLNEPNEN